MFFRVLGPLDVEVDGRVVTPRAHKQRQVLALLLMEANKPVKIRDLVWELWDETPPASAVNTLQTYILRIRRILSETSDGQAERPDPHRIATQRAGYLLRVEPDELDLHDFGTQMERATEAMARRDYQSAVQWLERALSLNRGPILADVPVGPLLEIHVSRVEEGMLRATETRIEAELYLGRHRQLVGELTGLAAQHRTHERLHGYLMIALYRAGRRVEALQAYHRLRASLVRELGLEPTAWLTRIQHEVLTAELDVDAVLNDAAEARRYAFAG